MNKILLHLEGLAVFLLCLYFYWLNDFSWWLFLLLILAPDLAMIGYLLDNRIGAIIYNLFHTYIFSLLVISLGWRWSDSGILAVGLIWMAHIGLDRMVGYGLKYASDFKDNHLSRMREF